jgi:TPR repeat protein
MIRSRLQLTALLAAFGFLSGCIDPPKAPYVAVHDLSTHIDDARAGAEQGSPEDQYRLGLRYEQSVHNYGEAVRWYRMAAIQEYSEAFYRLCLLSDVGRGVPQDFQEALRWCRLAADHGHAQAMFMIGTYFEAARGVPKDAVQAHQWYNLAAANGYEEGVKRRNRLAQDMSPSQIAQAQFQARNWRGKYQDSSQRMPSDQPFRPQ